MQYSKNLSEIFKSELSGYQKVGIIGYGREGKSSFALIRKYCPDVDIIVSDKNQDVLDAEDLKQDSFVEVIGGKQYLQILERCDVVYVSPGISLLGMTVPTHIRITSQTDFLFRHFSEKIVAVTGTKGKSTTASLIAHILRKKHSNVPLAGNIGIPPFDILEQLIAVKYAVFEVSSHQLQYVTSSPGVAVLLNLFPEHLDYYPDTESYYKAKQNIFKHSNHGDCVIVNKDDPEIQKIHLSRHAVVLRYSVRETEYVSAWIDHDDLYTNVNGLSKIVKSHEIMLPGKHNISNCLAAICACSFLGLTSEEMHEGIKTFRGLPHRMECIDSGSDRKFYNDSIATIPEATLAAVEALKPVATLILGGMDRGLSYDEFLNKLQLTDIRNVCFYGEAGLRMFEEVGKLHTLKNNVYFRNFEECVLHAISLTRENETCLLSPAASSYDQFKNFEERGEVFRKIIAKHFH